MLVACSDIGALFAEPKTLTVKVKDISQVNSVNEVLLERFHEHPQSIFYSVKSFPLNDEIKFSFTGGIPPRDLVDKIISVRGQMHLKSQSGVVIASSQHVQNSSSAVSENKLVVNIRLTDEGERRLHKWSSENIGKLMSFVFDDEVITVAKVMQPLGRRFLIAADFNEQETKDITLFLRSGALDSEVYLLNETRHIKQSQKVGLK